MPWYARTIETVTGGDQVEPDTDRMWRQIDPVIQSKVQQIRDDKDGRAYLPHIVEKLFEIYPELATDAIERGHLTLRTHDDLPYGLALFDDRVGIGSYDKSTGLVHVFVDTDAPIAHEWAERVYASVKRILTRSPSRLVLFDKSRLISTPYYVER